MTWVEIPLTGRRGGIALVDLDDVERVQQHRWSQAVNGYVISHQTYMHRWLLGLEKGDRRQVDHRNRNRLDNRRANLRITTHKLNGQNRTVRRDSGAGFRGVNYHRDGRPKPYSVQVYVDGTAYRLGSYATAEEAGAVAAAGRRLYMTHAEESANV